MNPSCGCEVPPSVSVFWAGIYIHRNSDPVQAAWKFEDRAVHKAITVGSRVLLRKLIVPHQVRNGEQL